MVKIFKRFILKSTSLPIACKLVLFLCLFAIACKPHAPRRITLTVTKGRAVGLRIPKSMLGITSSKSIHIRLNNNSSINILGDLKNEDNDVVFSPLVPLLPGLTYVAWLNNKEIGRITVPVGKADSKPYLVALYPNQNVLPENLLKFYLHFSTPMRAGQSLAYIKILNSQGDTLNNVFLNLQPELWDSTGTTLTLWLDPGRIKRDLQPNLRMGNPLKQGESYTLLVSNQWKDTRGQPLAQNYVKHFVAATRDDATPAVTAWAITIPTSGTRNPLTVNTKESLDHYLLQESVSVLENSGQLIKGRVWLNANDNNWKFTPNENWQTGTYTLQVNARLEDLAGNNLNRLFDRDITKDAKRDEEFYKRVFTVQ